MLVEMFYIRGKGLIITYILTKLILYSVSCYLALFRTGLYEFSDKRWSLLYNVCVSSTIIPCLYNRKVSKHVMCLFCFESKFSWKHVNNFFFGGTRCKWLRQGNVKILEDHIANYFVRKTSKSRRNTLQATSPGKLQNLGGTRCKWLRQENFKISEVPVATDFARKTSKSQSYPLQMTSPGKLQNLWGTLCKWLRQENFKNSEGHVANDFAWKTSKSRRNTLQMTSPGKFQNLGGTRCKWLRQENFQITNMC